MANGSPQLVHYTDSIEKVVSILEHGFLLVPNRRELIGDLLDPELFRDREPQQFGMVSFTQVAGLRHRQRFGAFGIAVSPEWAAAHGAQRVLYLDKSGPVLDVFRWLFALGKQEFDSRMPDAPTAEWALKNKVLAGMYGAVLYSTLLTLYEFMQPERDSAQVEWRIVEKYPFYTQETERTKVIAELLDTVRRWKKLGSVRVGPSDLVAFTCPRRQVRNLRDSIPERFREIPIESYATGGPLDRLLAKLQMRAELRRSIRAGHRTGGTTSARPATPYFQVSGVAELPFAASVQGGRLFRNPVFDAVLFQFQYLDDAGRSNQLSMGALDAIYLRNFINVAMRSDEGLRTVSKEWEDPA